MILIALMLFGAAIALWRHSHTVTDEVNITLELIGALICLMAGLALAPLPLKGLTLTALLVYPTCAKGDRRFKPDCPRSCLLRRRCRTFR